MSASPPDSVSAVVVAYDGGEALLECVASLRAQTIPLELIVVDNASTDGSIDRLEAEYQDVRVVRHDANRGYAAGANTGWRSASSEVVAILNQDLVVMPDCLERMRDALVASSPRALVTPKLLLKSDPSRVNAIGNEVHLCGVAWCNGLGTSADDWHGTVEVTAISGAAFMARTFFLEELGGLEEAYFMYMEDIDLSLRARLAGGVCLAASDATALHDYALTISAEKFRLLERNRLAMSRRFRYDATMRWITAYAEAVSWAYALLRGRAYVRAKLQAGLRPLRVRAVPRARRCCDLGLAQSLPYRLLLYGDGIYGDGIAARLAKGLEAALVRIVA